MTAIYRNWFAQKYLCAMNGPAKKVCTVTSACEHIDDFNRQDREKNEPAKYFRMANEKKMTTATATSTSTWKHAKQWKSHKNRRASRIDSNNSSIGGIKTLYNQKNRRILSIYLFAFHSLFLLLGAVFPCSAFVARAPFDFFSLSLHLAYQNHGMRILQ